VEGGDFSAALKLHLKTSHNKKVYFMLMPIHATLATKNFPLGEQVIYTKCKIDVLLD
jgi:uncharacterized membrane protein YozB (DUF420 family)